MDENRLNILNQSNRMLSKLQLLSVFFGDDMIYKIYLRSQVIHKLFEANPELDINKLDLFHLQFTQSLIDLLRKIKKNNETNVSLLFDEIQINREMIERLNDPTYTLANFNLEKQRQALKINLSLRKLFQVLSDSSTENPLSKNINAFSSRFAADFFYTISTDLMEEVTAFNLTDVYKNEYAKIQRKLMGVLCKYDFKTEFYCGLKSGAQVIEVYKFIEADRYFIYAPGDNLFVFFDVAKIAGLDMTTNMSKKERLMYELKDKNDRLEGNAAAMKAHMPPEIAALLADNYKKISDITFLDNISNIDVQANILKSMLNTDLI
ncbi:hypothetical protein [Mucilaginibacter ginsenosidivorax]|uniref:Uncharacterized protein n=1 Tax=Mucilaginibacter ginsenosidivorax TaxID=862126 RepID=A0A5B8W5M9_9SPHI|nr:hypothetical protein [Mucilaginibacter ginsenosidivorax]QEC77548.1 hypothetical protein FSB76_16950 [Mucilaginibacter ginsenosidivorax]